MEGDEPPKTKYNSFETPKRNISCGKPIKKDLEVWDPPSPKRKLMPKPNIPKQSVTSAAKMPTKPTGPAKQNSKVNERPANNNANIKERPTSGYNNTAKK